VVPEEEIIALRVLFGGLMLLEAGLLRATSGSTAIPPA